jgi:hypothetical protein
LCQQFEGKLIVRIPKRTGECLEKRFDFAMSVNGASHIQSLAFKTYPSSFPQDGLQLWCTQRLKSSGASPRSGNRHHGADAAKRVRQTNLRNVAMFAGPGEGAFTPFVLESV